MNKDIKYVVDYLEIPRLKKEKEEREKRLFFLNREMAKLTFNRNVALYAFYTDEIDYLILKQKSCSKEESKKIKDKIIDLNNKALKLTIYPQVREYFLLRDEYYKLLLKKDYFIVVNYNLREELPRFVELPPIYVEQSHFEADKHIIDKTPLNPDDEEKSILVDPLYYMESIRDYRHFYNKVSFHYLEQLCEDYSFDLQGKDLGKVHIRGLKKNY